ncbi:hypothetical protein [Legionella gresilensis]|uniref:hypothetical protein n=1 Tax=Legionella gresilensis TaxID=91823 RepID=UPI0010411553|nr:hypothetical protein [Legionella gresilensis]
MKFFTNTIESKYYTENIPKEYSFIILQEDGTVIGAGRCKANDEEDKSFLAPKDNIIPNMKDNTTHAFIILEGKYKNDIPVQILLIRGFIGKDSGHTGIFDLSKTIPFKKIYQAYNITIENHPSAYKLSGECGSDILIDMMKNMLSHSLKGIRFNTKGSQTTNKYRYPDSAPVSIHIPETLIIYDPVHDKHIKLHGPEWRSEQRKWQASACFHFLKSIITQGDPFDKHSFSFPG